MPKQVDIRCPRCRWRPGPEARWQCSPPCNTVWHTFWTRGLCPGCGKQWEVTQCLACHRHSPHQQWYHLPDDAGTEARAATTLPSQRRQETALSD